MNGNEKEKKGTVRYNGRRERHLESEIRKEEKEMKR